MVYATVEDLEKRCRRTLSEKDREVCETLLEDAAVIIDTFNRNASGDAKKVVSCNMLQRAIGNGEQSSVPIGATQGSFTGLGYTQSWTMSSSGSTGELYLSRLDKRLLGVGTRIGMMSPLEDMKDAWN